MRLIRLLAGAAKATGLTYQLIFTSLMIYQLVKTRKKL